MATFTRNRAAGALPVYVPTVTDTFDRANASLASPWSVRTGTATVDTNNLRSTSTTTVIAHTTSLGTEHKATLLVRTGAWQVCVRMGASGTDRYLFGYDFNRFKIRKSAGGTLSTLVQAPIATVPVAPYLIELEVRTWQGAAELIGRVNGVRTSQIADPSALTGALVGASSVSSTATADSFAGYDL